MVRTHGKDWHSPYFLQQVPKCNGAESVSRGVDNYKVAYVLDTNGTLDVRLERGGRLDLSVFEKFQ